MLEANLVAHHGLDTQLSRLRRYNELQADLAAHAEFLSKKRAEPAVGDLVAVSFDIEPADSNRDRQIGPA